jgi:hypothetical protein
MEIKYQIGSSGTMNRMIVQAMNSLVVKRNFKAVYPNGKLRGCSGPL